MVATIFNSAAAKAVDLAIGTRVVLVVEYEGTHYYGFQLQANLPTIQGEMEEALQKLTGEKSRVMAASRTDTGVHAKGQVVSFKSRSSLPAQTLVKGLNYYLPRDIAVKAGFRIDDSFNVRRRAIRREYHYQILNSLTPSPIRRGFSYFVTGHLDVGAMNQACQALIGEHDLASFATSLEGDKIGSAVRNVYKAEVEKNGDMVTFIIEANSFLRHQVRNTVGTLIRIGLGKMTVVEFWGLVEARSPGLAWPAAPAHGLCLMRISYPVPFGRDV